MAGDAARWPQRVGYPCAIGLTAACALTLEIVAARLLAPHVGTSLHTWTALIAVVLAGLSLGNWVGGRLAPATVDASAGALRAAMALGLGAVATLATLMLMRVLPALVIGYEPTPAGVVTLTALVFLLPSACAGVVSPLLTKLAVDHEPERAGRVLGRMYAAGSAGSILGTLATGYFVLPRVGARATVLCVVALQLALAVAFALASRRRARTVVAGAVAAVACTAAAARAEPDAAPCLAESGYSCINVFDTSALTETTSAALMLDRMCHGIADRDPTRIHAACLELIDELARLRVGPGPIQAFQVGGGAYLLPRAWLHQRPGSRIVVAEIDPEVTRVAIDRLWFAPGPEVTVVHGDGRVALQGLPRTHAWQVVVVDAYRDHSIPVQLVTEEFHAEVAARLAAGGFYAINTIDRRQGPRIVPALVRTVQQAFPAVEVWIENELDQESPLTNYVVVAGAVPSPAGALASSRDATRTWTRRTPGEMGADAAPILTDDLNPVELLASEPR
jgi:predicted membrane-bound spermidine synthase